MVGTYFIFQRYKSDDWEQILTKITPIDGFKSIRQAQNFAEEEIISGRIKMSYGTYVGIFELIGLETGK